MKKVFSLIISLVFLFILSSCKLDTESWPVYTLPFKSEDLVNVHVSFRENKKYIKEFTNYSFDDSDTVNSFYNLFNEIKYQPKEKKIDEKNYWYKIILKFNYLEAETIKTHEVIYYGFGLRNGKLVYLDKLYFTNHEVIKELEELLDIKL
jgi:hypothetical protein